MIPKPSPKEGLIIEWPATQPEKEELQKVSARALRRLHARLTVCRQLHAEMKAAMEKLKL